ncbi:MAG: divergent PAP2 family protein [Alistipes sp.]|nr:divergent PAP2 family protein [Alistipes sp.]
MEWLVQLSNNKILISSILAWFLAQVLKTLINFLSTKEFNPERLFGSGGMPSSHSSTVCALVAAVAIRFGFDTYEFAMAAVFAIVVMYDAMNVRREAGKHARWINLITTTLQPDIPFESKFKEYLGHTPLQVLMGALLGIATAFLIM